MGSSTSLDRYSQSPPEVTANAVWDEQPPSEEKKVGTLKAERRRSHTTSQNPRPKRDYLDNLIKIHEAKAVKQLDGRTRKEFTDQHKDLHIQKQRRGHPKDEPQRPTFATTMPSNALESRIEMLTKRVDELEKHKQATSIQMEAILVGKKALETRLEAAINRIQTLSNHIEKAKCSNTAPGLMRRQDEGLSNSALLLDGTSGKRKRKTVDDEEERKDPKAKNQRLVS